MSGNLHEETKEYDEESRQMALIDPATTYFYTLYSRLAPSKFAQKLIEVLKNQDVAAVIDKNFWKISFEAVEQLDDQQIKSMVRPLTVKVQVEILQHPNKKDVIAAHFKKISGNKMFFCDWYDGILEILEY